jgi:hypothetical protein
VIFEKESSSNGTPPNIAANKGKVDRIDLHKVQRADTTVAKTGSKDRMRSLNSHINLTTYREESAKGLITPKPLEQSGIDSATPINTPSNIPFQDENYNEEELN